LGANQLFSPFLQPAARIFPYRRLGIMNYFVVQSTIMYDTVTNLAMFLTYESAERMYGLPRHALLKLARDGRIHVYRPLGRKAYIRRDELEEVFRASADAPRGEATG
jgi:hypothetical protein